MFTLKKTIFAGIISLLGMGEALASGPKLIGEYKDWIYTDTEFLCRNFIIKHFKTLNVETNVQISGSFSDGVAVTLVDGSQFVCTQRINGAWQGDILACVYLAKSLSYESLLLPLSVLADRSYSTIHQPVPVSALPNH